MKTLTKRDKKIQEKLGTTNSANKLYEIEEALQILKGLPPVKFDQTIQIALNLGIDPKKSEHQIRGAVSLPKGIGKSRKVIVFAAGDEAKTAREAGADEVGADELIKKITEGWTDFDVAIAPPNMMKIISKLGKILGPQGKMPSPKNGTVTEEIANAVKEFKAGKVEFRIDAAGIIHAPLGKLSFSVPDLKQNIEAFLEHIQSQRPISAKGVFIKKATLSATMSPGFPLKLAPTGSR
ncbi:MAG: 50S ribosomal protein L1 [bacterium]